MECQRGTLLSVVLWISELIFLQRCPNSSVKGSLRVPSWWVVPCLALQHPTLTCASVLNRPYGVNIIFLICLLPTTVRSSKLSLCFYPSVPHAWHSGRPVEDA